MSKSAEVKKTLKKPPRIYYVSWLPLRLRGACLPPVGIFINTKYKGDHRYMDALLAHDLIHWRQYERMGLFMYAFRYVAQIILIGYDTMPMEMEARQFEKEYIKWNYRKYYHNEENRN